MSEWISVEDKFPSTWERAKQTYESIIRDEIIIPKDYIATAKIMAEEYEKRIEVLNSPWISVNNRLPNKRDEYIVVHNSGIVTTMDWTGAYWVSDILPNHKINSITHWMPLPEPPTI